MAPPDACLTLETIHRFADPAYAELSTLMRTGERSGEVFDALPARGQIVIHDRAVAGEDTSGNESFPSMQEAV